MAFNIETGKHEFIPEFVVGNATMFLGDTQEVRVQTPNGTLIVGMVTPYRDEHGNMLYYATSKARPNDQALFWSEGGAKHWITIAAGYLNSM